MAKVKVLIEGYAKQISTGWIASSSVTLVESNSKKLIVDPGCNRKKIINALSDNNLKPQDIDFVLLTHNHTDHILLAGIFEKAKVLNNEEIYDEDKQVEHNNKIPRLDLEIMQTPGHTSDHCSLVVPTAGGIYIIAGDVFWWMDDEAQEIIIEREDQAHSAETDIKKAAFQQPLSSAHK